jgi:hypothetical protein
LWNGASIIQNEQEIKNKMAMLIDLILGKKIKEKRKIFS